MTVRELILDVLNDVRPGLRLGAAQKIAGGIEEGLKIINGEKAFQPLTDQPRPSGDVSLLVHASKYAGDKILVDLCHTDIIRAVKHVRITSNLSLVQAKNVVDLVRQHLGLGKLRIDAVIS